MIIAGAAGSAGWSHYAKDGRATFYCNVLGIKSFSIDATTPVPTGKTQVHMEFAYDGGGMGKGGTVTLYDDGKEVGTGRVDQAQEASSPPMRPLTSAARPAPWSARTTPPTPADSTARSRGSKSNSVRTPRTPTIT